MTDAEFIAVCRESRKSGRPVRVRLRESERGCKFAVLDCSGVVNGNPHDVWIWSSGRRKVLGRAYLGSRKMPQSLESWPERIVEIV